MKVLVTRRIPVVGLEILRAAGCTVDVFNEGGAIPRAELQMRARGIDGLLALLTDRIDATIMDAAPDLRVISNYAVGYDNIDLDEARRRGITVTNTPDVLTDATADLTFALLLGVARRLVEGDRMMREGRFRIWDPHLLLGHSVAGATLGIVGMGRIGTAVARRALGFGMDVVSLRHGTRPAPLGRQVETLDALLDTSDFISLHVPLSTRTHHMIGAAQLARMKATAYLINTARGPLVDEEALAAALADGCIAGAALDVFEHEPKVHPNLISQTRCLLAPHIGSATVEARDAMARVAATNLAAVLHGETPPNRVC